eukprot:g20227.t1
MTPEEYLVSTQQCVPATNQSTALLYINEMEHMPQSHLFALILPHLLRVCLAWKRKVEVAPLRELQCLLTELNSCKGEWTGCLSFTSGAGWTDVPFGAQRTLLSSGTCKVEYGRSLRSTAVYISHHPHMRFLYLHVLLACRCVVGLQLLEARSTLRLLQWNLHSECFLPCAVNPSWSKPPRNATHELLDLLRQVDFAGIEQLSDQDFWQSLNSTWGQIHHSCGGTKGFGVYPFDLASLLYRQTGGWAPSGQPVGGCMEKVIVMVAHFPHEGGYEAGLELLSAELQDLKRRSGVEEVLLLADTNQQKGNAEIMHDIDASSSAKTAGNDVQITLLVELEMRGEPRSWAKAPSPAVLLTVLLAVVLAW